MPTKSSSHKQKSSLKFTPEKDLDLFHRMVDHIGDEVMLVQHDGRIVFVNEATVRGLGFSKTVLLRKHVMDFFEEKMSLKQWQKEFFSEVKKKKIAISYTIGRKSKEGASQTIDITAVYMRHKSEEYVICVSRDVTERLSHQDQLKETEKMRAVQHLIAGTTQEIQHPLKGLLDHAEDLIENYKDRHFEYIGYKEFKDIMQTLEAMRDQARYCFDTTDRLLNLNKRKVGLKNKCCDVNSIIRQAVKTSGHHFEVADIKVKLTLNAQLPSAAIGELEFNQIMSSVLTNAIQAIHGGGVLQVKSTYHAHDKMVRILIKDDGVGIPQETLSRIFEPFFTTKHRGLEKSSGLGLTIVYSIVKAFRGKVHVKSHLKKGTTVEIILPVYKKNHKV